MPSPAQVAQRHRASYQRLVIYLLPEVAEVAEGYRQRAMTNGTLADAVSELAMLGAAAVKDDAALIAGRHRAYREASKIAREKLAMALRELANELLTGRIAQPKAEGYVP